MQQYQLCRVLLRLASSCRQSPYQTEMESKRSNSSANRFASLGPACGCGGRLARQSSWIKVQLLVQRMGYRVRAATRTTVLQDSMP